jgi:hypothetical protein
MSSTLKEIRESFESYTKYMRAIQWHLVERPEEDYARVCGTHDGKTERCDVGHPLTFEGLYRAIKTVSTALTKHLPDPLGVQTTPVDAMTELAQRSLDRGYPVVSRHNGEVFICFHQVRTHAPSYFVLSEDVAAELSRMLAAK